MQGDDLLVLRLGRYFRHPDPGHDVLTVGDRAIACVNLRSALEYLGLRDQLPDTEDPQLFDGGLAQAVRHFQTVSKHAVADGKVGPNTRRRLVLELLARYNAPIFGRLQRHAPDAKPTVFLSYASEDVAKVAKLDQWLGDRSITVIRDERAFIPGHTIDENIRSALTRTDKIVAVYSKQSQKKDWPRLELALGEELERRLGERLLIYVRLDGVKLPSHDPNRLSIDAAPPKTLREIGEALLHAVYEGYDRERVRLDIDEDTPL